MRSGHSLIYLRTKVSIYAQQQGIELLTIFALVYMEDLQDREAFPELGALPVDPSFKVHPALTAQHLRAPVVFIELYQPLQRVVHDPRIPHTVARRP